MAKEILLYSALYSYTASQFIKELEEGKDDEITIRMNTPGGEVYSAYGMIAKFKEHKGKKTIKVDGMAASAGAFLLCFLDESDKAEALDVSEFLFHRASYGSYIERNPDLFTDEMKASLISVNNTLRAAMESKIDAEAWKEETGISLDDLFSLESRIDVTINAKQAKKLGLIQKVNKITPEKKAEIETLSQNIAATAVYSHKINNTPKNTNSMTIEKLKAEHPDVYAQVMQLGVSQERNRVEALLNFVSMDAEATVAKIKDGTDMTASEMAAFAVEASKKSQSNPANIVAQMQQENAPEVAQTPTSVVVEEPSNNSDFLASIQSFTGIEIKD